MPDKVLPYQCPDSTIGECPASRHCKLPTTEAVLLALAATSFGKYHQGFLQDVPDLICSILTSDEATCKFHPTAVSLGNHVSGQALFCKRASCTESPNNCKHSIEWNPQLFVAEAFRWENLLEIAPSQGTHLKRTSLFWQLPDWRLPTHCSFGVFPPSIIFAASQTWHFVLFCFPTLAGYFPVLNSLRSYKIGLVVRIQQDNVYKAAGI